MLVLAALHHSSDDKEAEIPFISVNIGAKRDPGALGITFI
jgi:hypothetical protein